MADYDPEHIRRYYDAYGEREWVRLESSPCMEVNFHIHLHHLKKFIQHGHQVLEAGAGPGRFTIELAKFGAQITVGDISPTQLELNRIKVQGAGCEMNVVSRQIIDITDLSQFGSESFDVVV